MNYFTFAIITTLLLVSAYAFMVYVMIGIKRRYTQPVVHLLLMVGFGVFATVAMVFYTALEIHETELYYSGNDRIDYIQDDIAWLRYEVQDNKIDAEDKAKSDSIKFHAIFDDLDTHGRVLREHKHNFSTLNNNVTDWARGVENTLENLVLDVNGDKRN